MCVDCLCDKTNKAIGIYQKDNKSRLIRIIVSCILYAIGLFLIIAAFVGENGIDLVALICGIALCGIYTGITWHKAARQSRQYLLRFWRITIGALLCQSRSHVPQARASRLFLALLVSNAPKLPCTRGEGFPSETRQTSEVVVSVLLRASLTPYRTERPAPRAE